MPWLISKILAVIVAIGIGGNTGFCACGDHAAAAKPPARSAPQQYACEKCREKAAAEHPTTQPQKSAPAHQPCPNCQNTNKPDRAVEKAPSHSHAMMPMSLPTPVMTVLSPTSIAREVVRIDTGPPLLLDLFHSSCLLTI